MKKRVPVTLAFCLAALLTQSTKTKSTKKKVVLLSSWAKVPLLLYYYCTTKVAKVPLLLYHCYCTITALQKYPLLLPLPRPGLFKSLTLPGLHRHTQTLSNAADVDTGPSSLRQHANTAHGSTSSCAAQSCTEAARTHAKCRLNNAAREGGHNHHCSC